MRTVVAYLARIELRHRWRAAVAVAVLVAVVVGVTLTAVAGSRRSGSAFDRYLEAYRPASLYITGDAELQRQLAATDGVLAVAGLELAVVIPAEVGLDQGYFPFVVPTDDQLGQTYMQAPVLEGRHPDPAAAHEVALGQRTSRRLGVTVGETLPLVSFTQEGTDVVMAGGSTEPDGPMIDLDVVGIVRDPGDVAGRETDIALTFLTPAFGERYAGEVGQHGIAAFVDVADGAMARVTAQARQLGSTDIDPADGRDDLRARAEPLMGALARGLLAFAAVTALAGTAAVGLMLSRLAQSPGSDDQTLAAMGISRTARALRVAAPGLVAVTTGVIAGAAISVLASPVHPIGIARRAETQLGVDLDATVLGLGVAGALLVGAALVGVTAWGAIRRSGAEQVARPTRIATAAAQAGAPVTTVAGLTLAGARRTSNAGAVRTAAVGATAGAVGVLAAVVFASSVDRLVSTPALYGWGWDAVVVGSDTFHLDDDEIGSRLVADPGLVDVAEVTFDIGVEIDGRPELAMVVEPRRGGPGPVVIDGRAPQGLDEVAVGGDTLRRTGTSIGDEVRLSITEEQPATVVGVVALPVSTDGGSSTTGAVLTREAVDRLGFPGTCSDAVPCYRGWGISWDSGTDPAEVVARHTDPEAGYQTVLPTPPAEIEQLVAVEHLPWALAALLAALAATALVHGAVATVRRRRRDLAMLRALGFTAGQLRSTVVVQVAALTAGGAALGALLGVVIGRQVWRVVTDAMLLPFAPSVPVVALVLVPAGMLVLAQLGATGPRRAAGTVRPADVLRAE